MSISAALKIAIDKHDIVDYIAAAQERVPAEAETFRITEEKAMISFVKVWWLFATLLLTSTALAAEDATPFRRPDVLSRRPARSLSEFLTPDNRFDLEAVQQSGYQGPLDLKGFNIRVDPTTNEPTASLSASELRLNDPNDIYWDNSISPCIPGVDGTVAAAVVYNGSLVVGGHFTIAGCVVANHIASWDGTTWSPLGSGMNSYVSALTVYDDKLIAGGWFTVAGGASAKYVASWDGTTWSPLGSGMDYGVNALVVYDGKLIAGGHFKTAGGVSASHIASWDGITWSPLGSGTYSGDVNALAVYHDKLIAGGEFWMVGGVSARGIASWDGTSWSALGSGISPIVSALAVYDDKLIAGGWFTIAGGGSDGIASWDGSAWSRLGSGMNYFVAALTVLDNKLIAGGASQLPGTQARTT